MPRKGHISKRKTEIDPIYGSDLVTKFVNSLMYQGKKEHGRRDLLQGPYPGRTEKWRN